jgi:hypothetical protein
LRDEQVTPSSGPSMAPPGGLPPIPPTSTSTGGPSGDKSKELLEDFPVNFN